MPTDVIFFTFLFALAWSLQQDGRKFRHDPTATLPDYERCAIVGLMYKQKYAQSATYSK